MSSNLLSDSLINAALVELDESGTGYLARENGELLYFMCSPLRHDANPGSFRVNVDRKSWYDFADTTNPVPKNIFALLKEVKGNGWRKWVNTLTPLESLEEVVAFGARASGGGATNGVSGRVVSPYTRIQGLQERPEGNPFHGLTIAREEASGLVWFVENTMNCELEDAYVAGNPLTGFGFNMEWRLRDEDGKKDVRPVSYILEEMKWAFKQVERGTPLPMFGFWDLYLSTIPGGFQKTLVIVEGPKVQKMLAKVLDPKEFVVIAFPGGASRAADCHVPLIENIKRVILSPDADEAGEKYMVAIGNNLAKAGYTDVSMLNWKDMPKGWDLADAIDEGWATEEITKQMVLRADKVTASYKVVDLEPFIAENGSPYYPHDFTLERGVSLFFSGTNTGKSTMVFNHPALKDCLNVFSVPSEVLRHEKAEILKGLGYSVAEVTVGTFEERLLEDVEWLVMCEESAVDVLPRIRQSGVSYNVIWDEPQRSLEQASSMGGRTGTDRVAELCMVRKVAALGAERALFLDATPGPTLEAFIADLSRKAPQGVTEYRLPARPLEDLQWDREASVRSRIARARANGEHILVQVNGSEKTLKAIKRALGDDCIHHDIYTFTADTIPDEFVANPDAWLDEKDGPVIILATSCLASGFSINTPMHNAVICSRTDTSIPLIVQQLGRTRNPLSKALLTGQSLTTHERHTLTSLLRELDAKTRAARGYQALIGVAPGRVRASLALDQPEEDLVSAHCLERCNGRISLNHLSDDMKAHGYKLISDRPLSKKDLEDADTESMDDTQKEEHAAALERVTIENAQHQAVKEARKEIVQEDAKALRDMTLEAEEAVLLQEGTRAAKEVTQKRKVKALSELADIATPDTVYERIVQDQMGAELVQIEEVATYLSGDKAALAEAADEIESRKAGRYTRTGVFTSAARYELVNFVLSFGPLTNEVAEDILHALEEEAEWKTRVQVAAYDWTKKSYAHPVKAISALLQACGGPKLKGKQVRSGEERIRVYEPCDAAYDWKAQVIEALTADKKSKAASSELRRKMIKARRAMSGVLY